MVVNMSAVTSKDVGQGITVLPWGYIQYIAHHITEKLLISL